MSKPKVLSYFDDEKSDNESEHSEENFGVVEDSGDESDLDNLSEDSDYDTFKLEENFNGIKEQEAPIINIDEMKIEADDDFDVPDDDMSYLQKFTKNISESYLADNHPECIIHNNMEIDALASIIRDDDGVIIDDKHRTLPILTKYEKTRIIGERAKQLNKGAKPYIEVPFGVIDGYNIAELELKEKRIPFIIQRPLPNGSKEFWKLTDLEQIE
jgi:DNA-directed RNA polymerase subunit K/omega